MDEIVKKEESHYTDCYIAFLDLLGFKGIINKKTCDEILSIFAQIKPQPHRVDLKKTDGMVNVLDGDAVKNVKMKIMSDSICFYIDSSAPKSFCALLMICLIFQIKMASLPEPILMRGGIVRGKIYASGDITFGPGLTSAYLLEEKSARFPRIIMTGDTLENALNETEGDCKMLVHQCVFRDEDAFYAIRYFDFMIAQEKNAGKAQALYDYAYKQLNCQIDPSVREKYQYLEKNMKEVLKTFFGYENRNKAIE